MMRGTSQRIDGELYREISHFQRELSEQYGRPVTFREASQKWFKKVRENNTLIIGFK
jgi:hypothetical protein